MEWINVNSNVTAVGNALRPDNHSYRYGDGLFETIKVAEGEILLADMHFERLEKGMSLLKIKSSKVFTWQNLKEQILDLCKRNNCVELARVRVSVSGGHGGLYDGDENLNYIIECWPLPKAASDFNEHGLLIDIFPDGRKSCDAFSNLKSASHLLYAVAARFAKENKLNDCLVVNTRERICDTSIANLFWISDGIIFTPPLSEGCIAGVMRGHLIETLQATSCKLQEAPCETNDLENADEIFVTNAIQGIKWVREFRGKRYGNEVARRVYQELDEH